MASTLRDTVNVNEIRSGLYRAEPFYDRARMGNIKPIAYGGIVLSLAISAAHYTIPTDLETFHLYSVQGTYLGPSSISLPTVFHVQSIRTTRSLITRLVIASQPSPEGSPIAESRNILIALVDFHISEPALLEYSAQPLYPGSYDTPETLPDLIDYYSPTLSPPVFDTLKKTFHLSLDFFDYKPSPSSMGAQNALGFAVGVKTTQDDIDVTKRTNSGWVRVKEMLQSPREHCGALRWVDRPRTAKSYADSLSPNPLSTPYTKPRQLPVWSPQYPCFGSFLADGALGFLPLTLTNQPFSAASAFSSLDFSLRILSPPDLSQWHLYEHQTEAAGGGRTMSVGRFWGRGGKEVAVMSQACILRGQRKLKEAKL